MIEDGIPIPLAWPRGSLRQWLVALGALATLMGVLYLLFSWLGW